MRFHETLFLVGLLAYAQSVRADDPLFSGADSRAAIERAIPLIEAGSARSAEERTCFTCHNQALPILALTEIKRRGFAVDESNLERQLKHTLAHLKRGKKNYLAGKGQGGKSITAGYALWALQAGGHAPDETTAAVTHFLLEHQKDSDHWRHPGSRPPTSGSDFTTTSLVLRALTNYGTQEQETKIDSRVEAAIKWLAKAAPKDTEDQVFRLYALTTADSNCDLIRETVKELFDQQNDDGGWAQTDAMNSDAYATGTVLTALLQTGAASPDDASIQRGKMYLLNTQCEDGSWHVVTRAKAFQEYYESGFPHEEDQFISIAASCWATIALSLSLPEPEND